MEAIPSRGNGTSPGKHEIFDTDPMSSPGFRILSVFQAYEVM
jgi:hypothetical protein